MTKDDNVTTAKTGRIEISVQPASEPLSLQAQRVLQIIAQATDLFIRKNAGYGDTGYVLGARGQYADMNRKMGKLKHTLWDGNDPVGESNEEMLMDLMGHCGLTIDFVREGNV